MNLITVRPNVRRSYRPVTGFDGLFDALAKDFFASTGATTGNRRPALNVIETEDDFRLEMAVPGLTKEDISVEFKDDLLTISAKNALQKKEGEKVTRQEFGIYDFKRSFELPESVDANAIEASVTNGILIVKLGKKEEAKPVAPRKIEIA